MELKKKDERLLLWLVVVTVFIWLIVIFFL